MLTWKYGEEVLPSEIEFTMSTDFDPTPLGVEWVQLVTDWYQQGLTSREVWIDIIKKNDLLSPNYNDAETIQQIRDMAASMTQGATPDSLSAQQTGSDYLNQVNGS
jgi:sugar/nucleoside kinase (ribokinase family)